MHHKFFFPKFPNLLKHPKFLIFLSTSVILLSATAAVIFISDRPAVPATLSPATAYWALDEGNGQTVNDRTGNANSGTLGADSSANTDDPTWATPDLCVSDKCLQFTGSSSQYVNVAGSIAGIKTVNFWVRPTSVASISLLVLNGAAGNASLTTTAGGVIQAGAGFSSPTIYINGLVNSTLTANQWQYVSVTTASGITASNVILGRVNTGYFNGFMDEVKLYNFALTATQIKPDYIARGSSDGAGAAFNPDLKFLSSDLVGYWKMEDLTDSSGNGQTLTNNNSSATTLGKFGTSYALTGSSKYLSYASPITGVKTVAFWVYPNALTNYHIDLDGTNYLTSNGSGVLSTTGAGWTNPVIYVNGAIASTLTISTWNHVVITSTAGITTGTFQIGRIGSSANYSNANFDDVRLYNRAFTPSEVQTLYNWGPSPVAYWKMDDNLKGTGQLLQDSSGYGNNISITNDAPNCTVNGRFGSGCYFNGTVGDIRITGSSSLQINNTITIEYWQNAAVQATAWTAIISKMNLGTAGWQVSTSASKTDTFIRVDTSGATNQITGALPNTFDGTWHHIVWILDNGTRLGYKDGVLLVNNTYNHGTGFNASAYRFSIHDGDQYVGTVDDVRIYNYARTQAQITEDMNASHPAPGSPIGSAYVYYKFDEGYGSDANAANNAGFGGSTLNGTITSGTWTTSGKFGKAITLTASSSITSTIVDPAYSHTISVWVYPTTSAASKTIVKFSTTDKLNTDGSSQPLYGSCTGTALALSVWTHIVAVSNGSGSCAIYQNGVLTSSGTTGVTLGTALNIGGSSFIGTIDEFKLYNFPLTAAQVKVEYNQGSSQVLGSLGTTSTGATSNSSSDSYCPPGQGTTCVGPLGEWKFDENTGAAAKDTSGTGNTGTINGTVKWINGKIGSAVSFPGTDSDYIVTSSMAIPSAFSFEFWIKTTTAASTIPVSWNYIFCRLGATANKINCSVDGGSAGSAISTSDVNDGKWHHVSLTSTSNVQNLYIDGKLEGNATETVNTSSNALYLGRDAGTGYSFTGSIDDFKFYNYVRTQAQIAWDYNRGAPVARYKFDECTGTIAYNSALNSDGQAAGMDGTITLSGNSAGTCASATATDAWYLGSTGKFNSAIGLDGNDYVTLTDTANYAFGSSTQDFSAFAWVKRAATGAAHTVISKEDADDDGWRLIINSDNTFTCKLNSTSVTSTATVDTTWHHIGCVINRSGTSQMYLDGKPTGAAVSTTGITLSIANTATTFGVNDYTARVGYFTGLLDEIQIYNYALTSSQVKTLYNNNSAVQF